MITRRALPLLLSLAASNAWAAPVVRVGMLRFGSVAWELDVMRHHGLDQGFALAQVEFAAAQASQVALQAGTVDLVLQDWLWVSRQRASGAPWTFAPATAALGAIMAPAASPLRGVADLPGKRLGVAGSPLDKSWLLLRAYASRVQHVDLDAVVEKMFGPPPLLAEQLAAGRLDAVLTYWPFAARAEAQGQRAVLDMEEVIAGLDVPHGLPMVGYVFSAAWAAQNRAALQAFLAASHQARTILAESDPEWDRIAPLTGAKGAGELDRLRAWYRRGLPGPWNAAAQQAAAGLYDLFAEVGGPALVGPAAHLAPGTFWQSS